MEWKDAKIGHDACPTCGGLHPEGGCATLEAYIDFEWLVSPDSAFHRCEDCFGYGRYGMHHVRRWARQRRQAEWASQLKYKYSSFAEVEQVTG